MQRQRAPQSCEIIFSGNTAQNDAGKSTDNDDIFGFLSGTSPIVAVQNVNDSGAGSLRQAFRDVCLGGVINFDPALAGQTVSLGNTLEISKDLTIDGSGLAAALTLSSNDAARVLRVTNNARVTLAGLLLARGKDISTECSTYSCGGALKIDAGATVTLTRLGVFSSTARLGGGIYNAGVLTI